MINGDFEEPTAMPVPGQYWTTYYNGETFGGWTVSKGSVDHRGELLPAARGIQSVDLTGDSAGAIYQDLSTQAGQEYLLRFYLAGNPGDGTGAILRSFEVWWNGALVDTLTVDMTERSVENMQWESAVYDRLAATDSTTRLEFLSLTPGIFGPTIDLVAVVPMGDVAVDQITSPDEGGCVGCCGADHRQPLLNAEGTQISFSSTADLDESVGNVEHNRELFRYDLGSLLFLQDSQTSEGFLVPFDFRSEQVVFQSTAPDVASNADMNADLFLVDTLGAGLIQLTDTVGPGAVTHAIDVCPLAWFTEADKTTLGNIHADLSANGSYVVWASNRNIPSLGHPSGANADGNYEIYQQNLSTTEVVQLTNSTGGDDESEAAGAHLWPRTSADGARTVFVSNRNWGGATIAAGRYGLFVAEGKAIQRVTTVDLDVDREFPAFSMDSAGQVVVFASGANLTGGNADGNTEILAYDFGTQEATQITSTLVSATSHSVHNHRPILSGDRLKVAFLSNADFGGSNSDGSEDLWVYHFEPDLQYPQDFIQVTELAATPDATEGRTHWLDWHDFDEEGTRLVWTANADLAGGNPSHGYEIFLSTFEWNPQTVLEDVNGDEAVNAIDVQLVINAALGLSSPFNCDVNRDGDVNALDVQLVINAALGLS